VERSIAAQAWDGGLRREVSASLSPLPSSGKEKKKEDNAQKRKY
jgi:hypothetical protein